MAGGRTMEQRVSSLEKRVKAIETNGGKMRAAMVAVQTDVESVKADIENVRGSVETIQQNTDDILSVVRATREGGKFLAKHMPRVVAAVSGAAVYAGFISPKVGDFFSALFN
jgi:septal ring factor EnvC (AmiA/AmiB activator)